MDLSTTMAEGCVGSRNAAATISVNVEPYDLKVDLVFYHRVDLVFYHRVDLVFFYHRVDLVFKFS